MSNLGTSQNKINRFALILSIINFLALVAVFVMLVIFANHSLEIIHNGAHRTNFIEKDVKCLKNATDFKTCQ